MDAQVLRAQQWLNQNYGDNPLFSGIDEDGITGSFMFSALTEAWQNSSSSDTFNTSANRNPSEITVRAISKEAHSGSRKLGSNEISLSRRFAYSTARRVAERDGSSVMETEPK